MWVANNSNYSLLSTQYVQRKDTASISLDLKNHNHSQKIIIFGLAFWMKMLSSVQFSHSKSRVWLFATPWIHELQHTKPPCPSPTPGVYSDSCSLSQWCPPAISSSAVPFSSCPQSLPASGSFPMSQFFTSGGQSIGVSASASVLTMNTRDWYPLGWTGWISLQSKGLSRVFSNTTVQKHQFFGVQLSSQSNSHIHTYHWKNHSLDQMDLCWQSNVSAFQYAI